MPKWLQCEYSFIIKLPELHSRIVRMGSTYNVVEEEYVHFWIQLNLPVQEFNLGAVWDDWPKFSFICPKHFCSTFCLQNWIDIIEIEAIGIVLGAVLGLWDTSWFKKTGMTCWHDVP